MVYSKKRGFSKKRKTIRRKMKGGVDNLTELPDDILQISLVNQMIEKEDDPKEICRNLNNWCSANTKLCNEDSWKYASNQLGIKENIKDDWKETFNLICKELKELHIGTRKLLIKAIKLFMTGVEKMKDKEKELTQRLVSILLKRESIKNQDTLVSILKSIFIDLDIKTQEDENNLNNKFLELDNSLIKAVQRVGRRQVEDILKNPNVDIEATNNDGKIALIRASEFGKTEVVKVLLKYGANIEVTDEDGRTALHNASRMGYIEVVTALLENGANVDARDSETETALHYASRRENDDVIKLLLENSADVNAKNEDGSTALHIASRNGNLSVVETLLDKKYGPDVNAKDTEIGETALHLASRGGHKDVVELLLEKGANVDATVSSWGPTALHFASRYGNLSVVETLLDADPPANEEAATHYGETALMWASEEGHTEVVRFLLEKGANINATNMGDKTALDLANEKLKKKEEDENEEDEEEVKNLKLTIKLLEKSPKIHGRHNLPIDNDSKLQKIIDRTGREELIRVTTSSVPPATLPVHHDHTPPSSATPSPTELSEPSEPSAYTGGSVCPPGAPTFTTTPYGKKNRKSKKSKRTKRKTRKNKKK